MSSQLSLLESNTPPIIYGPPPLRDYQQAAVYSVELDLLDHRGTLVLCATGTGKTQIAAELIRRNPGRCLFIAHRDELIQQASKRIEQFTGEFPEIEQADFRADHRGHKNVVASVQTLSRQNRLERFDPSEFSMIVIDETHHVCAKSYRKIIDYFDAKLVGLTATPDRTDKEALGQILDSVAYRYDILDAIRDGWLCEVVMKRILVGSMDFSKIKTVAGDLSQDELAKVLEMEENLHAIAKPAVELSRNRQSIVFAASVAQAERLAEVIDRYANKKAAFVVHGKTDKDERRKILKRFENKEFQFFVNVGIACEGYDNPEVSCVVMGRPTKSRSLYVQMLGRGTRGGTNCRVGDKTDCLILDFVGNTGRHEIVSAADVLGGTISEKEMELAKELIEKSDKPKSIEDAAAEAKELISSAQLEAARKKRETITGDIKYAIENHDPFVVFDVKRDYMASKYGMDPATEKQVEAIGKWMGKHSEKCPQNLSRHEASRMLQEFANRRTKDLASFGQISFLAKKGIDARLIGFKHASRLIDWSKSHGWAKPPQSMVSGSIQTREPGED